MRGGLLSDHYLASAMLCVEVDVVLLFFLIVDIVLIQIFDVILYPLHRRTTYVSDVCDLLLFKSLLNELILKHCCVLPILLGHLAL